MNGQISKLGTFGPYTDQELNEHLKVGALCMTNPNHASKILTRLAAAGFVTKVSGSFWTLSETRGSDRIAEYLSHGQATYISLQSALSFCGVWMSSWRGGAELRLNPAASGGVSPASSKERSAY